MADIRPQTGVLTASGCGIGVALAELKSFYDFFITYH